MENERPTTIPEMPSSVRLDGWAQAFGIGSQQFDKRQTFCYAGSPVISYQDAILMWRGDDIAARAIETVPNECFRQGYEITIADEGSFGDLKEQVEQKLSDLRADHFVETAYQYERAYGGGAVLLGVDDNRTLDKPMDMSRVTTIEWLDVLEPIELYPLTYYDDPTKAKYGQPRTFQVNRLAYGMAPSIVNTTTNPVIHESRLLIFGGIRVSRYQPYINTTNIWWGDSILMRLSEVLRDFNIAWSSAGIIATDFSQAVITIPNLMALVAHSPQNLQARLQAIELGRNTARAVVIDSEETYERKSTNLAGLSELLMSISTRCSAATGIPLKLLLGQSPAELGGTGESDMRYFYDWISGQQRRKIGPAIKILATLLMGGLRKRKLPKRWGVKFHPLYQHTDKEKAEARLTQARADSMYIKMGAVTCDEIRRSRFVGEYSFETQVNEKEKAPGIPYPPMAAGSAMVPGSPTEPGGPDGEPGKKQLAQNQAVAANKHGVKGYIRNTPTASPLGPHAQQGGDVANPKENRDHQDALKILEERKLGMIALFDQMIAEAQGQEASQNDLWTLHENEECDAGCPFDHDNGEDPSKEPQNQMEGDM